MYYVWTQHSVVSPTQSVHVPLMSFSLVNAPFFSYYPLSTCKSYSIVSFIFNHICWKNKRYWPVTALQVSLTRVNHTYSHVPSPVSWTHCRVMWNSIQSCVAYHCFSNTSFSFLIPSPSLFFFFSFPFLFLGYESHGF